MANGDGPGGTLGDSPFLNWLRRDVRDNARALLMQGATRDAVDAAIRKKTKYRSLADVESRVERLERVEGANRRAETGAGWRSAADRYSRNVLQGASVWTSDELANALPGGETTASLRGQLAKDMSEHPVQSTVEQGFGALAPAIAATIGGGLLAPAGMATLGAGAMGLGAGIGGVEALAGGMGMSNAPTLGGRFMDALPGAGVGAAAGAASPPAAIAAAGIPFAGRLLRSLRSPQSARNIMARSIPTAEAAAVPEELAAMQSLAPGARVMDTRAGQRIVGQIAGESPEAQRTLADAVTNRDALATTALDQVAAAAPTGRRARYAVEFWKKKDVRDIQRWLGSIPEADAQAWKELAVGELAPLMANATDKLAFLQSVRSRLEMVLPPDEFAMVDRGIEIAQRMQGSGRKVAAGADALAAREAARQRAAMGLAPRERQGFLESLVPKESTSRGTRVAVEQLADYLAQEHPTGTSPLLPQLFGRNMAVRGRPIDPQFANLLAGIGGSQAPLAVDLFRPRR